MKKNKKEIKGFCEIYLDCKKKFSILIHIQSKREQKITFSNN
jgi:hypothetical protein